MFPTNPLSTEARSVQPLPHIGLFDSLACAAQVSVGGVRIAGCSGIYKSGDYVKGHFEAGHSGTLDHSTVSLE